jgi:uncharacterized membrane protein
MAHLPKHPIEKLIRWIGSIQSLILHSVIFVVFFALSFVGILSWDLMFLILTTVVSLEAIYLAIFIQMTVNRHSADIEDISEDIEGIQEDVQDMSEDVEDIQEDIQDISEEKAQQDRLRQHALTLENMTKDIQHLLADLEELKKEG